MICPVCSEPKSFPYDEDKFRTYHLCSNCSLIYVPREKILSFQDEASRYDAHENDEDSLNYRDYLTQTAKGIWDIVGKKSKGLDFGCGKTVLLEKIFEGHGIEMDSYDLYFHPKEDIWKNKYDFIILSEVVEHLSHPTEVMKKLSKILNRHGRIFIKTKLYPPDPVTFHNWFYKRDMTHVQFFDYSSLAKLADLIGMQGPHKVGAPDLYEFKK